MAARPWENRFLDINLKDGVMFQNNGSSEEKIGTKTTLLKSAGKKTMPSSLQPILSSQIKGLSLSDGSSSSPIVSSSTQEATGVSIKPKSKSTLENLVEEHGVMPGIVSRSYSNPKETVTLPNKHIKKRLSLPNTGNSLSLSHMHRGTHALAHHKMCNFYCENIMD